MNGSGQSRPGRRIPLHCFSSLDQSPLSPSSRLHLGISTSNSSIGEAVKRLRPYLSVLCVLPPPTQLDFEIKAKSHRLVEGSYSTTECNCCLLGVWLPLYVECIGLLADPGHLFDRGRY